MRTTSRITWLAVGAAASVAVAGCSSSKGGGPSTSAPAGGSSAAGTTVQVTEKDFSISLPSKTLTAGSYTFQVNNTGSASHNLTVEGRGVSDKATSTIDPGSSGQVTVTLQQGSYELYCSIDGHKDRGMDLTVQVG
jgi:VCBS repeat-containing protein